MCWDEGMNAFAQGNRRRSFWRESDLIASRQMREEVQVNKSS